MEAWIVLGLAVAGILTIVVWMVVKAMKQGYPEGKRVVKKWKKYRINVITHNQADILGLEKELEEASLRAIMSVVSARTDLALVENFNPGGDVKRLREYNVYITPASLLPPGYTAYTTRFDNLPTAEIVDTGEPVIHESLHALLDDFVGNADDHADETIWAVHGSSTVQATARRYYKTIKQQQSQYGKVSL